ncbi:MAG: copper chaperone PCu(A)C [Alphaproteobacteria bacterium]|nr:copper chaperone PCu(A)C [Alphaproteobacteria bacterium]
MKILSLLAAFLVLAFPAMAGDAPAAPGITAQNGYAFVTSPAQKTGGAFLTIANAGKEPDKLLSVATDICDSAEMHAMLMEGDTMAMIKKYSIEIPAEGNYEFEASGDHIMLLGLHEPLKEGQKFTLKLNFEKAGTITTDIIVKKPDAGPEEEKIVPESHH